MRKGIKKLYQTNTFVFFFTMSTFFSRPFTLDSTVKLVLGITAFVCAILLIKYLSPVLFPFCLAWLLAYMIYPFVSFVQNKLRVKSRSASALIVMTVILSIIGAAIYFLTPRFMDEAIKLKNFVANYTMIEGEGTLSHKWEIFLQNFFKDYNIADLLNSKNLMELIQSSAPHVWSLITSSFSVTLSLFTAFITLIYIFFILRDYKKITHHFGMLVPQQYRSFVLTLYKDMEEGMKQYYRGQVLVALSVTLLYTTGFLIIDLPMAVTMGLLVGTLNLVPYLQVVGIPPCILLSLVHAAETGTSPWIHLLLLFIVFAVVQVIQDGYLVPKIMGQRMGLNAAVILLSLSIFGMIFGFIGVIIALPTTTLLFSYYRRYFLARFNEPVNETQEIIEEENQ